VSTGLFSPGLATSEQPGLGCVCVRTVIILMTRNQAGHLVGSVPRNVRWRSMTGEQGAAPKSGRPVG
jgi:hypothetical protein